MRIDGFSTICLFDIPVKTLILSKDKAQKYYYNAEILHIFYPENTIKIVTYNVKNYRILHISITWLFLNKNQKVTLLASKS